MDWSVPFAQVMVFRNLFTLDDKCMARIVDLLLAMMVDEQLEVCVMQREQCPAVYGDMSQGTLRRSTSPLGRFSIMFCAIVVCRFASLRALRSAVSFGATRGWMCRR
jgi:hypothetical protein